MHIFIKHNEFNTEKMGLEEDKVYGNPVKLLEPFYNHSVYGKVNHFVIQLPWIQLSTYGIYPGSTNGIYPEGFEKIKIPLDETQDYQIMNIFNSIDGYFKINYFDKLKNKKNIINIIKYPENKEGINPLYNLPYFTIKVNITKYPETKVYLTTYKDNVIKRVLIDIKSADDLRAVVKLNSIIRSKVNILSFYSSGVSGLSLRCTELEILNN